MEHRLHELSTGQSPIKAAGTPEGCTCQLEGPPKGPRGGPVQLHTGLVRTIGPQPAVGVPFGVPWWRLAKASMPTSWLCREVPMPASPSLSNVTHVSKLSRASWHALVAHRWHAIAGHEGWEPSLQHSCMAGGFLWHTMRTPPPPPCPGQGSVAEWGFGPSDKLPLVYPACPG